MLSLDSSHARVDIFFKKEEKEKELFNLLSKEKYRNLQIAVYGRF
jgi:hypothetical protein